MTVRVIANKILICVTATHKIVSNLSVYPVAIVFIKIHSNNNGGLEAQEVVGGNNVVKTKKGRLIW